MNDDVVLAIGRQLIELCLQREDLIKQVRALQAKLPPEEPPGG